MQLPNLEYKFDVKKVEQLLLDESRFITNLLSLSAIPERHVEEEDYDEEPMSEPANMLNNLNKKSRAKSLLELEERLKAITSKKKLTYKEKLAKKSLKNRMKKKNKQDVRNAKSKLERAAKLTEKNNPGPEETESKETDSNKKPMFNKDNKMVFSKIDFANLGKKKIKKQEKNPQKLLEKLGEEKNMLQQLEQKGEIKKVVQIKEKTAWKNALAKTEGQKIKDDPLLLKKSVKKKEQKVRSSKKKWEVRQKGVDKAKDERQKKRKDNIEKKKKEKKNRKLKSAAKRGKIIPGF